MTLPLLRRRAVLSWAASATLAPVVLQAQTARLPRLVTVGGAITEIVYALGAEAQLVGTDTTSLYPLAAQNTPKVGYMRSLSAEGLLALKPDAVIGTTEAGPPVVMDQLRSAGVKVDLIASDHSWAEVQRKLQAVGRGAGREAQARALQVRLDADWAATQQLVAQFKGRKPKVLFILSHSSTVQVAGEKTAADAMLRFIGAQNVMAGFNGYRPMTAEAMAAAAPDLILTSTQGIDAQGGIDKFWSRPELALTPAFKTKALVHLDALELLGFGPRMPATVRALHQRIVLA
ncbi:iron complex transport system substrate-binding protein [Rhodoferax sp. OV413]|uniref:heme/hemin ABC transporter substrate-binding protein n=1 Tax=Rhodoferax sp. OV413 TaxID=1855285 RepID=UPI00088672DE|nr:ABC transporter substrate-binding protein [Rhodoferax sp. OV413]SDP08228.1 iron complex transport system substrate-binding protein [Rhodoferax sp. OV413]